MRRSFPRRARFVSQSQWNILGRIISYNSDGRTITIISRLLDLGESQGKLEDLLARVEAARKEMPGWKAGGVLKALIECRLGRLEQGREEFRQLFARSKDESIPSNVYWIVGSELENYAATRDLAVTAYEISAKLAAESQNSRIDFDYGPAKRLVSMYVRDNRLEDARRILINVPKSDNNMSYPDGYLEQMRMQSLGSAANELLKLGFAADAVTLYNESIALAKDIPADSPNYIGNREALIQQQREGLTRALEGLQPEDLASSVTRMIASSENTGPNKTADTKGGFSETKKGDPLLNLVVLVHPARARQGDNSQPGGRHHCLVRSSVVARRVESAGSVGGYLRGVAEDPSQRPFAGDRRSPTGAGIGRDEADRASALAT